MTFTTDFPAKPLYELADKFGRAGFSLWMSPYKDDQVEYEIGHRESGCYIRERCFRWDESNAVARCVAWLEERGIAP
jgi:hypothetical protein